MMTNPILNHSVYSNEATGYDHLEIEHDGTATWLDLQKVKNAVWGEDVVAFEMYPPQDNVVNGGSTEFHYRHLWRWPDGFQWPNFRPEGV